LKDNIEVGRKEIVCEIMDWTARAQDRAQKLLRICNEYLSFVPKGEILDHVNKYNLFLKKERVPWDLLV
jgi:hypothetical protein